MLNLYNVYTNMYIHHTLSAMYNKEQYIDNNKHVEQGCTVKLSMININVKRK